MFRPGDGLAIVDRSSAGREVFEIGYNLFINLQLMGRTGMAPPGRRFTRLWKTAGRL